MDHQRPSVEPSYSNHSVSGNESRTPLTPPRKNQNTSSTRPRGPGRIARVEPAYLRRARARCLEHSPVPEFPSRAFVQRPQAGSIRQDRQEMDDRRACPCTSSPCTCALSFLKAAHTLPTGRSRGVARTALLPCARIAQRQPPYHCRSYPGVPSVAAECQSAGGRAVTHKVESTCRVERRAIRGSPATTRWGVLEWNHATCVSASRRNHAS